jgi:hypothetical protein
MKLSGQWTRLPMAVLCLLVGLPVFAACPNAPAGFVLPATEPRQVDLIHELAQPWQAGGEIVVVCGSDGQPLAGRLATPPQDERQERARRAVQFALAKRLNMARRGEAHPLGLPLAAPQMAMLERFAMSDAGAVWLREVADDTLRLFNRGYLEYDQALWKRAVKRGRLPTLTSLINGRLSEQALFAGDASVFKFSGYAGPGATAHPGAIGLGDAGLKCHFPASDEPVDPMAIISHEFGHTRYGDPGSGGTLLGEAQTVERYENPVRIRNGFEPRILYFERSGQGDLQAGQGSLLDRLLRLERERGIDVGEMKAVDRLHCDCPGPLPIVIDCEVREGGASAAVDAAGSLIDQKCRIGWKPDLQSIPANPLRFMH